MKAVYNLFLIRGLAFHKKVFFFIENNLTILNVKPKFLSLNIYVPLRRNASTMGANFTNINMKENEIIAMNFIGLYDQVSFMTKFISILYSNTYTPNIY